MLKIWDRAEQSLAGMLGIAAMRYLIRLAGLVSAGKWSAMLPRHAGGHESPRID